MSDDTNWFDRRKVLKTTAIGFTGGSALTTTGAAQSRPDSDEGRGRNSSARGRNSNVRGRCDECGTVEVISEDETHTISAVDRGDEVYVYRVSKETGSVEFIDARDDADEITGNDGISTMDHDEIIERSTLDVDNEGSCPSWVYSTDYSVIFAVETGDTLDEYPTELLGAALCAAIGTLASGGAAAALSAAVCYSATAFFLSHIDLSGRRLSIGAWDCHQGWLNEPSVCTGATASYTTYHPNLVQGNRIPGAHLSMGSDIDSYF